MRNPLTLLCQSSTPAIFIFIFIFIGTTLLSGLKLKALQVPPTNAVLVQRKAHLVVIMKVIMRVIMMVIMMVMMIWVMLLKMLMRKR